MGQNISAALESSLQQFHFPLSNLGSSMILSDGRCLGYMEYVDPSLSTLEKSQLPTILFFPGLPGSRLFTHPVVESAGGYIPGVRMLVVERPGIGLSSPHSDSNYTSIAEYVQRDISQLLDNLNLTNLSVLGYSAGAPYALACGVQFGPERVVRVVLVAAVSPLGCRMFTKNIGIQSVLATWLLRKYPRIAKWIVVSVLGSAAVRSPIQGVLDGIHTMATCDQNLLIGPFKSSNASRNSFQHSALQMFAKSALECARSKQNGYNYAQLDWNEFSLWRNWGFSVHQLTTELSIFHGELDLQCSVEAVKCCVAQAASAVPSLNEYYYAEEGHTVYFKKYDEIIRECIRTQFVTQHHIATGFPTPSVSEPLRCCGGCEVTF